MKDEYDYAVITGQLEILIKDLLANNIYRSDDKRWLSHLQRLEEIQQTSPNLIEPEKIKELKQLYQEFTILLNQEKKE